MSKIPATSIREVQRVIDQARQPKSEIDIFTPVEDYEITLPRIYKLLSDSRLQGEKFVSSLTGVPLLLGNPVALSKTSGIAKSTFDHAEKKGEWVETKRSTFVRLAALLNQMEPPLVDPLDPLKRPIRFPDREVPGLGIIRGYEVLRILHERSAPDPELLLPPQLSGGPIVAEQEDEPEDEPEDDVVTRLMAAIGKDGIETLAAVLNQAQKSHQETQKKAPVQPQRRNSLQMKISRFAADIMAHMDSVGAANDVPTYIDYLLKKKRKGFRLRPVYEQELTDLLADKDTLKKSETLMLLAEHAELMDGINFAGDMQEMLAAYGIYESDLT